MNGRLILRPNLVNWTLRGLQTFLQRHPQLIQAINAVILSLSDPPLGDDTDIIIDVYDVDYRRPGLRVRIGGKTYIISIPRRAACLLPLGKVAAGGFNYQAFLRLWSDFPPHKDLVTLHSWLHTSALADFLDSQRARLIDKCEPFTGDSLVGVHPHEVVETHRIAKRVTAGSLHFSARAFRVPKSDNASSRFVWNGRPFDTFLKEALASRGEDVPKMPRRHLREAAFRILCGWKHISTVDLTSFFFQFRVHPKLSAYFGFFMRGEALVMIVLPMGICFAPAWAQHVAEYLVQVVRARLAGKVGPFDIIVWVDNFVVLCDNASDDAVIRDALDAVFAELDLVHKSWEIGAVHGTRLTALGLDIDLRRRTVVPAAKTIETLDDHLDSFISDRTPAAFNALVGSIMHLTFIGTKPICLLPDFMRLVRSQARRFATSAPFQRVEGWYDPDPAFTDATVRLCCAAVVFVRSARLSGEQRRPPPTAEIFTDASNSALAGISHSESMFIREAPCHSHKIQTAELLAGVLGAVLLRVPPGGWTWAVDNTVAKYALLKGHSASDSADRVLRLWFHMAALAVAPLPAYVAFVPSGCNRADALTRLTEPAFLSVSSTADERVRRPCDHRHEALPMPRWNFVVTDFEDTPLPEGEQKTTMTAAS